MLIHDEVMSINIKPQNTVLNPLQHDYRHVHAHADACEGQMGLLARSWGSRGQQVEVQALVHMYVARVQDN